MPVKIKINDFKKKFIEKYGDGFDLSKVIYVNARTHVKVICKTHGEFLSTPDNLLTKRNKRSPCSKCSTSIARKEKRISTNDFIFKARTYVSNSLDYSHVKYVNSTSKVDILCPDHGLFSVAPSNFLFKKTGCPRCTKISKDNGRKLTHNDFYKRAKKVHKNIYKYDLTNYENNRSKIIVFCKEHGEFKPTASNFLQGKGCPKCAVQKSAIKRTLTTTDWISKAKIVHGDRYDYSKVKYVSSKVKVSIICKKHGSFFINPSNHISLKRGCAKCANFPATKILSKPRISQKEFISRCEENVTNFNLSFTKTIFNGVKNKVIVSCNIHGDFEILASNLLRGGGCKLCSSYKVNSSKRTSLIEFVRKSKSFYDIEYNYDDVQFNNLHDKVILSCPIHGKWEVIAANHMMGKSSCPSCHKLKTIKKLKDSNLISQDDFIYRCEKAHNFIYDYSKTKYTHSMDYVLIICKIHGEFRQQARNHMIGKGCPRCANKEKSKNLTRTIKSLLQSFKNIHGDRYLYDLNHKVRGIDYINIKCKTHGDFKQMARVHLEGKGCPKCSLSHGENAIAMYLTKNQIDFEVEYKINDGVTDRILRYDFFLPKYNTLLEYDGEQHYFPVNFGGMTNEIASEVHKKIVERDKRKNKWAKENNFRLIRIAYNSNIEDVLKKVI